MEEENKINEENQVVEVVPSEQNAVVEKKADRNSSEQNVLVAFILCCIATATLGMDFLGGVASIVLSAISINLKGKVTEELNQPYKTFYKIVSIAAYILLALGIIVAAFKAIKFGINVTKTINDAISSTMN